MLVLEEICDLRKRSKPKFGWRKLKFERQDCFSDNLMYTSSDRYHYVACFLFGCLGKMPEKKGRQEKPIHSHGTGSMNDGGTVQQNRRVGKPVLDVSGWWIPWQMHNL
jgi:hypothetical protein